MKEPQDKTPQKSTRNKRLVGPASAYSSPIPIQVETFMLESGECMTKLTFGQPFTKPVSHSADRYFTDALACPEMLANPLVWHVIKPWLDNPPPEIETFWQAFNTPETSQERMSATSGVKFVNWGNERILIQKARAVRRLISIQDDKTSSPGPFPLDVILLTELGEWVINAIEKDHEAPRRLYQLLKNEKAADDPKGDQFSFNGKIFNAFVQLVARNRKLPTKKSVRKVAGLGDDHTSISAASLAFKEMGLAGLPQG